MLVDPKTGFLDADRNNAFGVERKLAFLQLAEELLKTTGKWPDIGALCDKLDIDPRTLDNHLKRDQKFNEAFKSLTTRGKWKLESLMFDLSGKNPMYCFGWLRKYFPEEYNPEHRMTVTHEHNVLSRLADEAKQAIEAELVGEPKSISTPTE